MKNKNKIVLGVVGIVLLVLLFLNNYVYISPKCDISRSLDFCCYGNVTETGNYPICEGINEGDLYIGKRIVSIIWEGKFLNYAYKNQKIVNTLPLATVSSDTSFTPIFCNDYEFTCCNEFEDIRNQQISLKQGQYWQCPFTSSKCEVILTWQQFSYNWFYTGKDNCRLKDPALASPYWKCDNEMRHTNFGVVQLKPGEYVYSDDRRQCIGGCPILNKFDVSTWLLRLDFCGKSGCDNGVPVLGADQCHFNPPNSKVYSTTGTLQQVISYTVPKDQCVLSFQQGDRHICGYKEESCNSDNECGGHTYGNYECNGRTLQKYGCRSFGTPVSMEKDRLPWQSGWDTTNNNALFGKRCEIVEAKQVQCCGDTDCGSNMFCDRTTWTCKSGCDVKCDENADCGVSVQCDYTTKKLKQPVCKLNCCGYDETTVECCIDSNCPLNYYCDAEHKCKERVGECRVCPYECCKDECKDNGGYFDRPCAEGGECVNNQCKEKMCSSCFEWIQNSFNDGKVCTSTTQEKILGFIPIPKTSQSSLCPIMIVVIAGIVVVGGAIGIKAYKDKKRGKK